MEQQEYHTKPHRNRSRLFVIYEESYADLEQSTAHEEVRAERESFSVPGEYISPANKSCGDRSRTRHLQNDVQNLISLIRPLGAVRDYIFLPEDTTKCEKGDQKMDRNGL